MGTPVQMIIVLRDSLPLFFGSTHVGHLREISAPVQSPVAPAARLAGRAFDTLLSVMQLQQPGAADEAEAGDGRGALLEGIARDLLNLGTATTHSTVQQKNFLKADAHTPETTASCLPIWYGTNV